MNHNSYNFHLSTMLDAWSKALADEPVRGLYCRHVICDDSDATSIESRGRKVCLGTTKPLESANSSIHSLGLPSQKSLKTERFAMKTALGQLSGQRPEEH
jgi:hypothetical protein